METLYVGKFRGTHGIKGELKLDKVLNAEIKVNDVIIINNKEYTITSLRIHKGLYLITLNNMLDINQIFDLKNEKVYIKRSSLKEDLIPEDLLNFEVISNDKKYGTIIDIINGANLLLVVNYGEKTYYIPYYSDFINNVDILNQCINVSNVEDLIL